jgi:hypothetical protein
MSPITIEKIDKDGVVCCFGSGTEIAELTKILASASPPTLPEHVFHDQQVRVKIDEVRGGANQNIIAIVEEGGVVRRDGFDRVLSAGAMEELKRVVETRCKLPVLP